MTEATLNSSGKELLDATQEALMGAAGSVGKVLQGTTEVAEHHEVFYQSAEFWVGVSFVIVAVGLWLPLRRMMLQLFEKRRQGIVGRINDAAALKTEARELLADYEQRLENAAAESSQIVQKARRQATNYKKNSLLSLQKSLDLQEQSAEQKIAAARNLITGEIAARTAAKSISALRQVLAQKVSAAEHHRLIDRSIDLLSRLK